MATMSDDHGDNDNEDAVSGNMNNNDDDTDNVFVVNYNIDDVKRDDDKSA